MNPPRRRDASLMFCQTRRAGEALAERHRPDRRERRGDRRDLPEGVASRTRCLPDGLQISGAGAAESLAPILMASHPASVAFAC